MKLATVFFVIAFTAASNSFLERITADSSFCQLPCSSEQDCKEMYESCLYGTYKNYCGHYVCSRGPNQTCEHKAYRQYVLCGDGLSCRCNVCSGCSSDTLECYTNLNCKNESMDHSSMEKPFSPNRIDTIPPSVRMSSRGRFLRPARVYRPVSYPYALE